MIEGTLLLIISLLFAVTMLSMLSKKLRIAYPIVLVIAGLVISLVPNVPHVSLEPDLVFIIFLPPLLYAAAGNTVWREFWFYRRAIALLAFGLVILTAVVVAQVSHAMIPGFPLALGFLLGGIISPPDAVAATTVLENLKIPRPVVTILEGESLVNDASSLIVFRFAMAALSTGEFVMLKASKDFILVAVMGILIGLAVALIIYWMHRFLPTTPSIDTAITLIGPYLMYIIAEKLHYSGVLAVVSGGLFLSSRSHETFSYDSRLQSQSVWNTLVFLLNGIVFILIGLQLPDTIKGMHRYAAGEAVTFALVICAVTIIVRIGWVFASTYFPFLFPAARKDRVRPDWKSVLIIGITGMRGVVSLAAAFSIPVMLSKGVPFPNRNLVLFITFVVILVTLVLQGLILPFVVRRLNIEVEEHNAQHDMAVQHRLSLAVISYLEQVYKDDIESDTVLMRIYERYQHVAETHNQEVHEEKKEENNQSVMNTKKVLLELVRIRRQELKQIGKEENFPDEVLRTKETELDLEEARLRQT